MTEIPRIAVVGTGWWATQHHIPSLLTYSGAKLVALVDSDQARLAAASAHYDVPRRYRSVQELVADGGIDGVVVATQSASHYEIAAACLSAGIHVLVEKPMTLRAAEAWQLVELADGRGLHLTVGYTYHHTSSTKRVREIMADGEIGELVHTSALFSSIVDAYLRGEPDEYRESQKFRVMGPKADTYSSLANGGGQGHSQVTHAIGLVLHVTDLPVRDVSAYLNYAGLSVDVADAIAFRFENGAVGSIASTGNLRPGEPKQQEFRYYGTDGFALHDLVTGALTIQRSGKRPELLEPREGSEVYPQGAPSRHLADLIAGRTTENLAQGYIGARSVEFLEAVYAAAQHHQHN